jgi:uncharacterized protein HemY
VSTEEPNNKQLSEETIEETTLDKDSSANNADAQIQAHRQQHQQRLKKLFGGAGALLLTALIVLVAYQFFTNTNSTVSQNIDEPAILELSNEQIELYRDEFKAVLTRYEIEVQPKIDRILLSDWETAKVSELSFLKEQALTAFARGAFLQAKQHFENLYVNSNELITQWELQTTQHIEKATLAFNNDQLPQAQLNLNKALALMPTNLEALALQSRIDAYGEVAALLSDLEVAKIENNLPKQIGLLSDIIQLDPERDELNEDLANVKVSYNQQQLAELLESAESALKANQLSQAQKFVDAAKKIKPSSKGAQSLNTRIAQVRAQQSLSSIKVALEQAVKQDNWEEVLRLSNSALENYSLDQELSNFQSQAQQVLSAKKSLASFIARPARLADNNIREAATKAIQNAFAPSLLSPSLQQQIGQVASAIDNYSGPVDITIRSDGKTYLTVLGVGHVGEHKEKVISLTPGNYILQAKREGYRNKRLEFVVEANTPLVLQLICDDKI